MQKIIRTGKYFFSLFLILGLASCDEDDPFDLPSDRLDYGTFRGELKGYIESGVFGQAYFSQFVDDLDNPQKYTYGIYLEAGVPGNSIHIWFVRGGDVPEEKTYQIDDLEEEDMDNLSEWIYEIENFRAWIISYFDDKEELFFSDEGTITIEVTSDIHVEGEFDFVATGFESDEGNNEPKEIVVEFSGKFLARQGEFSF